jgi:hypothetical protein
VIINFQLLPIFQYGIDVFYSYFPIRYCNNGDLVDRCPTGHYCVAGTGLDWQQCPSGTYNNQTGLTALDECKPCPGGEYCNSYGLVEPAGPCDAGYYCEYGVDRAQPTGNDNVTSTDGICEMGGEYIC